MCLKVSKKKKEYVPKVPYEKQALKYEEQAQQLIDRGLITDVETLQYRLGAVSYYRLSGYLHPFRKRDNEGKVLDAFLPETTLETVWDLYCFDRKLRVLILDAIERIEVSYRTKLVYTFSRRYGAFGHTEEKNLPKLEAEKYLEWRLSLVEETRRSKEAFKKHYFEKYEGDNLPLWMVAELMSMGSLLTMFNGADPEIKKEIASSYGIPDEVALSWLRSLNGARNICAHHARIWNKELGYSPMLPNKAEEWIGENKPKQNRVGVILFICRYLLKQISQSSKWHLHVEELFNNYPNVPLDRMGLAEDWKSHLIWKHE